MTVTDEMMMAAASATGHTIHPEDLRKALEAALSASPAGVVKDIDEGRFEEWTLADFAAQCRMQSRQQLDPEFSRFMAALSARIMSAIEPAGVGVETVTSQPNLLARLASALEDVLPWAEDKWANPDAVSEIVNARECLRAAIAKEGSNNG